MPDGGSVIIDFGTSLPNWLLLVLCSISLLIAYLQYAKDFNFPTTTRFGLLSLRIISLFLLIFILWEPKTHQKIYEEIKNTINIYFDVSSSNLKYLQDKKSINYLQNYLKEVNNSSVKYNFYTFSEEVKELNQISDLQTINDEFELTNLQSVHNHFSSSKAEISLVFSDGIHTNTSEPYFQNLSNKRIYAVTFGDTTSQASLAIEDVVIADKVFTNEEVVIRTIIDAKNYSNETLDYKLYKKEFENFELITDSSLIISSNYERIAISPSFLTPENAKDLLIKVEISTKSKTTSRTKLIKVLNKETNIASVATNIHPDVASTRRLLREINSISLSSVNAFNNNIESISGLDSNQVLIVHAHLSDIKMLEQKFRSIPLIGFVQYENNASSTNSLVLADVSFDNETPFSSNLGVPKQSLPPLRVPLPAIIIDETTPLLFANIKELNTNIPVITYNEVGTKRIYITTDTWYSWFNYPDGAVKSYSQNFLLQLIDWVNSSKELNKIKLLSWPVDWIINKKYTLELNVLDEIGRIDKDALVEFTISSDESSEIINGFTKTNALGVNTLESTFTKEGSYKIKLLATKNGDFIDSLSTTIYVENVNLENELLTAKPSVLKNWTESTGGQNFGYSDSLNHHLMTFKKEINDLGYDKVSYLERIKTVEIAKNYYWFIILLILLSVEWFIRRKKNAL